MRSRTTERFRAAFRRLPTSIQARARMAYKRFREDPYHPSLRFKQIHPSRPICSVRIGLGYRAIGVRVGDDVIWFWVGSHADYDRLLTELR